MAKGTYTLVNLYRLLEFRFEVALHKRIVSNKILLNTGKVQFNEVFQYEIFMDYAS